MGAEQEAETAAQPRSTFRTCQGLQLPEGSSAGVEGMGGEGCLFSQQGLSIKHLSHVCQPQLWAPG